MAGERIEGGLQPLTHFARRLALQIVAQRGHCPLDTRAGIEMPQDQLRERSERGVRHHIARRFEHRAQRGQQLAFGRHALQPLLEAGEPFGGNAQIGQLQTHRIRAGQRHTGQPDIQFNLHRHDSQEMRGADIGQEADARLGHGDLRTLGDDAESRRLAEAHAAAHRNAVEQRHNRLRKRMQRVIEPVFVDKERLPTGLAARFHAVQLAHVAARAEALFACAAQHHGDDPVISPATLEQHREFTHHRVRQRVQRSRPVQRDDRDAVEHAKQDGRFGRQLRRSFGILSGSTTCVRHGIHDCAPSPVPCVTCHCGARFSRNALTPSR